jgi:hypothetical protein
VNHHTSSIITVGKQNNIKGKRNSPLLTLPYRSSLINKKREKKKMEVRRSRGWRASKLAGGGGENISEALKQR